MDKITVVCHKDHDRGYEDFQGKCLLCVIDELMLEMGNLMIQKQRAEKRKWVGLTDEEVSEIIDREIGFNSCWGPEEAFARAVEQALKEKNT